MALLETDNLSKSFGSVIAADKIKVTVEEKEIIGMIGANGAGKTTFVNMVTGYLKPTTGKIYYQGKDITPLPPRDITRIGICRSFQVPQVFMTLSLFDNLLIAIGMAGEGTMALLRQMRRPANLAAAGEILERYGMTEYKNQLAGLLPQGVRKLLDIAMAMVHNPKLILLDEPTSGVSIQEKYSIMDVVMGALEKLGVTVLFIEHDMDIIERYGKRVLAFYEGTIISDGPPEEVLKNDKVRQYVIGEDLHGEPSTPSGAKNA